MGEENQSGSEGQGARVRRTLGGAHTSAAEGGASKGVCDVRTARDSARLKIRSRAKESAKRRRPSLRGAAKRPHSERSERFKIKTCTQTRWGTGVFASQAPSCRFAALRLPQRGRNSSAERVTHSSPERK